jgi:hypothetical protein
MKKTDYTEPTLEWLRDQFAVVPFGVLRPAEIEIILAYFLMYHDDMLEKSEYELAEKYRITESKALRLKLEFGKRWLHDQEKSFATVVAGIGKHIFEDRAIELSHEENQKSISFILTDPYEL